MPMIAERTVAISPVVIRDKVALKPSDQIILAAVMRRWVKLALTKRGRALARNTLRVQRLLSL